MAEGSIDLPTLVQRFVMDTSGFDRAGEAAGKMRSKVGAAAVETGDKLTKYLSLPLLGITVAALKAGQDVSKGLRIIKVTTGETGKTLDSLNASFRKIGNESSEPLEKIATVMSKVHQQTGLTGPPLEHMTNQILELGRITGTELDPATIQKAFAGFGLGAKGQSKALDELFRISQKTGQPIQKLLQLVTTGGPQFRAFGLDVGQSASLIGTLEKAGVPANVALQGLRREFTLVAKAGADPKKVFTANIEEIIRLGREGNKVAALQLGTKIFGPRGASLVDALTAGRISLKDFTDNLGKSGKTILETADSVRPLSVQLAEFRNKATLALAPLGEKVLPIVRNALDGLLPVVTSVFGAFSKLPGPLQNLIVIAGGIGVALGPVLSIGGRIIENYGKVVDTFKKVYEGFKKVGDFAGDLISKIRGVSDEGKGLSTNFDAASKSAKAAGDDVKDLGSKAGSAKGDVKALGTETSSAKTNVKDLGSQSASTKTDVKGLGTESSTAKTNVKGLGTESSTAKTNVKALGTETGTAKTNVKGLGTETGAAKANVKGLGAESGVAGKQVKSLGTEAGVAENAAADLGDEAGNVSDEMDNLGDSVSGTESSLSDLGQGMSSLEGEAANTESELANVSDEAQNLGDNVSDTVSPVSDLASQLDVTQQAAQDASDEIGSLSDSVGVADGQLNLFGTTAGTTAEKEVAVGANAATSGEQLSFLGIGAESAAGGLVVEEAAAESAAVATVGVGAAVGAALPVLLVVGTLAVAAAAAFGLFSDSSHEATLSTDSLSAALERDGGAFRSSATEAVKADLIHNKILSTITNAGVTVDQWTDALKVNQGQLSKNGQSVLKFAGEFATNGNSIRYAKEALHYYNSENQYVGPQSLKNVSTSKQLAAALRHEGDARSLAVAKLVEQGKYGSKVDEVLKDQSKTLRESTIQQNAANKSTDVSAQTLKALATEETKHGKSLREQADALTKAGKGDTDRAKALRASADAADVNAAALKHNADAADAGTRTTTEEREAVELSNKAHSNLGDTLTQEEKHHRKLSEAQRDAAAAAKVNSDAQDAFAKATIAAQLAVGGSTDAFGNWIGITREFTNSSGDAAVAALRQKAATDAVNEAAATGANAQDVFAQRTNDVKEAADEAAARLSALSAAYDRLIGINVDADKAQNAYTEGLEGLGKTLGENDKTLDNSTVAGAKNRDAILSQVDAGKALAEALVRQKGDVEGARAVFGKLTTDLEATGTAAGLSQGDIDAYITSLGLTPDNVTTLIQEYGTKDAGAKIDDYNTRLGEAERTRVTHVVVDPKQANAAIEKLQKRLDNFSNKKNETKLDTQTKKATDDLDNFLKEADKKTKGKHPTATLTADGKLATKQAGDILDEINGIVHNPKNKDKTKAEIKAIIDDKQLPQQLAAVQQRIKDGLKATKDAKTTVHVEAKGADKAKDDLKGVKKVANELGGANASFDVRAKGTEKAKNDVSDVDKKRKDLDGKQASFDVRAKGAEKAKDDVDSVDKKRKDLDGKEASFDVRAKGADKAEHAVGGVGKAVHFLDGDQATVSVSAKGTDKARSDVDELASFIKGKSDHTKAQFKVEADTSKAIKAVEDVAYELNQNVGDKKVYRANVDVAIDKARAKIADVRENLDSIHDKDAKIEVTALVDQADKNLDEIFEKVHKVDGAKFSFDVAGDASGAREQLTGVLEMLNDITGSRGANNKGPGTQKEPWKVTVQAKAEDALAKIATLKTDLADVSGKVTQTKIDTDTEAAKAAIADWHKEFTRYDGDDVNTEVKTKVDPALRNIDDWRKNFNPIDKRHADTKINTETAGANHAISDFRGNFNKVNGSKATAVIGIDTSAANRSLDLLADKIRNIGKVRKFAKGGKFRAGTSMIVGEEGMEFIRPDDPSLPVIPVGQHGPQFISFPFSGTVIPAPESRRIAAEPNPNFEAAPTALGVEPAQPIAKVPGTQVGTTIPGADAPSDLVKRVGELAVDTFRKPDLTGLAAFANSSVVQQLQRELALSTSPAGAAADLLGEITREGKGDIANAIVPKAAKQLGIPLGVAPHGQGIDETWNHMNDTNVKIRQDLALKAGLDKEANDAWQSGDPKRFLDAYNAIQDWNRNLAADQKVMEGSVTALTSLQQLVGSTPAKVTSPQGAVGGSLASAVAVPGLDGLTAVARDALSGQKVEQHTHVHYEDHSVTAPVTQTTEADGQKLAQDLVFGLKPLAVRG